MSKEPLLLLPGLLCDETVWQHQIQDLADISDVLVPDYRDCDSMAAMAEKVLAMVPGNFSLAGHSMGARVAMEVVRMAPKRINRLALLDTSVVPSNSTETGKRLALQERTRTHGIELLVQEWLPPMVHPARLGDAQLMEPLKAMIRRMTLAQYEGQIRALITRPEIADLLPQITCSTIVLCGRQDSWRTPEAHAEWACKIPGIRFFVIEHCGHMAPCEQPEVVSAELRKWLLRE
ncbi:MAG: alpha/beta hydrolase [Gammaproteobacteria bacterium]|nr:alpha/beta hydrolase [Gammaproteobacteria bacterium]